MAVYDITEGRLPDHASGEYVDIIKAILRPAAGGYVNGELQPGMHRPISNITGGTCIHGRQCMCKSAAAFRWLLPLDEKSSPVASAS